MTLEITWHTVTIYFFLYAHTCGLWCVRWSVATAVAAAIATIMSCQWRCMCVCLWWNSSWQQLVRISNAQAAWARARTSRRMLNEMNDRNEARAHKLMEQLNGLHSLSCVPFGRRAWKCGHDWINVKSPHIRVSVVRSLFRCQYHSRWPQHATVFLFLSFFPSYSCSRSGSLSLCINQDLVVRCFIIFLLVRDTNHFAIAQIQLKCLPSESVALNRLTE